MKYSHFQQHSRLALTAVHTDQTGPGHFTEGPRPTSLLMAGHTHQNASGHFIEGPRPPSPERPNTPSSRPARRRHLIPAAQSQDLYSDLSPPASPSWTGSNRLFAPMTQPLHLDPTVAADPRSKPRPASASVAEARHSAMPELTWTGSMQLPAGLLKLTARPVQHMQARGRRHQFDWGFGNARSFM